MYLNEKYHKQYLRTFFNSVTTIKSVRVFGKDGTAGAWTACRNKKNSGEHGQSQESKGKSFHFG